MGNQARMRGRRLSEIGLLALALATLVSVLVIFPSPSASAVPPSVADYRFQGKLSTSAGTAPVLQNIEPGTNAFTTAAVDGSSRKVLSFPKGNGLELSSTTGVVPNNTYTIVVLFELNNVGDNASRFRRVVDFENGASDSGLYIERDGTNGTSTLSFYRQGGLGSVKGTTPIRANRYVQVAITRDASGLVKGYVDGAKQFEVNDAASPQHAVISGANTLRFFKDNTNEDSGGSVARIRLFNSALSDADVGRLDRLEPTIFTVNSNADLADNNLADGKCLTANPNECTLRAAVQQSDHTSGNDTINFALIPGGTITLTGEQISIDNEPDSLTINGPGARVLTVSGNNASRVFRLSDDASAVINNLKVSDGNATGTSPDGGGISTDGDLLVLNNVTVGGNSAAGAGGGIYNTGNDLKLSKTTVSGNTVSGNPSAGGGGIYNGGTGNSLTLTNSTVSGNSVPFNNGGGINNGGTMTLTNSTVSNNSAGQNGGGLNNSGTAILRNTIVANNTSPTASDAIGTYSTEGKNLIGTSGGVFVGSSILVGNPSLGPLRNNEGPTNTHALLSGSPAIDRASNTGCPSTDQRGVSRPRDGDGNGRARCDIGAFEK